MILRAIDIRTEEKMKLFGIPSIPRPGDTIECESFDGPNKCYRVVKVVWRAHVIEEDKLPDLDFVGASLEFPTLHVEEAVF